MLKRVISSVIGLPLLLLFVFCGGLLLRFGLLALSLLALYELFSVISTEKKPTHYVAYGFTCLYMLGLPWLTESVTLLAFAGFALLLLLCLIAWHETVDLWDAAAGLFAFFYVPFLMSFVYIARNHALGNFFVWFIFLSAAGSDTFAFFTGKALGKHKLCPKLSPKKTVEGAVGGVVGAVVLGAGFLITFERLTLAPAPSYSFTSAGIVFFGGNPLITVAIICAVCAVLSQLGDLTASAIKRRAGVKDFGHIIPGHGGILDRFDSLLFTAPGVYAFMLVL